MSIEGRTVEAGRVEASVEAESIDGLPMILEEADFHPIARALPVDAGERVGPVDVIRGVALLGILAMNIVGFAWPGEVYSIPIAAPESDRADLWLWGFNHLVFDTKMMTLFSMLFGAGLVLMSDRARGRGARMVWIYYRRVFWLLMIGLVHSYLIWDGDILVMYASCGLLLYPIRNLSAKTLIVLGVGLNLLIVPLWAGFRFAAVPFMEATSAQVDAEARAGLESEGWRKWVGDGYEEMMKREMPKREDFLEDIRTYRGDYPGIVKDRAKSLIWAQTAGFASMAWWYVGGRMLIGMGLMKLGVFGAGLSRRTYVTMMAVGYGVGLPALAFDAVRLSTHGFSLDRKVWEILEGWPMLNYFAGLAVVFGHIGLVMLICRAGALPWLTRRLGAAGRMALSCYLFDSIACTTLFYGYGLDFYGSLHRPLLYAIVLTIWTAQLLVCPLWLERFRFGPAEWLWRSLTYWKPQPMGPRPSPVVGPEVSVA